MEQVRGHCIFEAELKRHFLTTGELMSWAFSSGRTRSRSAVRLTVSEFAATAAKICYVITLDHLSRLTVSEFAATAASVSGRRRPAVFPPHGL